MVRGPAGLNPALPSSLSVLSQELPPSYEEYLSLRLHRAQLAAAAAAVAKPIPPPLPPPRPRAAVAAAAAPPPPPPGSAAACGCAKCGQGALRVSLPPDAPGPGVGAGGGVTLTQASTPAAQQRALRVALPPEAGSLAAAAGGGGGGQAQMNAVSCPCTKCQSRYGGNSNQTDSSNDLLFSLDTTTAMQGVLTDGIALCCTM
ncbi:hypothetical protein R5R35_007621 [Gryllus longicercus]|uniref:Uncharacterized protein n=1 Tax=Gryllus longicercus TaxID=2509291 RepID=A0AAN9VKI8_9ORTH